MSLGGNSGLPGELRLISTCPNNAPPASLSHSHRSSVSAGLSSTELRILWPNSCFTAGSRYVWPLAPSAVEFPISQICNQITVAFIVRFSGGSLFPLPRPLDVRSVSLLWGKLQLVQLFYHLWVTDLSGLKLIFIVITPHLKLVSCGCFVFTGVMYAAVCSTILFVE